MTNRTTTDGPPASAGRSSSPGRARPAAPAGGSRERARARVSRGGAPAGQPQCAAIRGRGIKLAANLPVGIELRGEVIDAYFDELVPIDRIQAAGELLPRGDRAARREARSGTASRLPPRSCAARNTRWRSPATGELTRTRCAAPSCASSPPRSWPASGDAARASGGAMPGDRDLRPLLEDAKSSRWTRRTTPRSCAPSSSLTPAARAGPEDVVAALDLPLRVKAGRPDAPPLR